MGDLQRTRSKVWWSNLAEADEEVASRVSSCSPSSSHKSQDSGFSDSEQPSPPAPVSDAACLCEASPQDHQPLAEAGEPSAAVRLASPRRFLCLDFTGPIEPPTHTSTPKSTATPQHHQRPARSVNLFKSFSQCNPESQVETGNPVRLWLEEIGESYDPECMTSLQSKSIAVDLGRQVSKMAAETIVTVRELQEKTKLISSEFSILIQQLECLQAEHVAPLVQSIVGNIVEFLYDYGGKQKTDGNKDLVEACNKLRQAAIAKPVDVEDLTAAVTALGRLFAQVVDGVLTKQIQGLVTVLEGPSPEMAVRSALASLTTLGLDGGHLSHLVADSGCIQALLAICLESTASSIRTAALRALATVCSMADTIRQLEQAGGMEILSEILAEETRPEPEISEAAAVLAQITAPWVEDNHSIHGLVEHLPSLVQSLTNLIIKTESDETLLLSAAALANLTFLESRTVWPLLEHGSAGHLLTALRHRGPLASVFLQEQAATLLANMAAVPESRPHLAQQRAVVALLCFLQIRHSPLECAKQIAAAERVQQKSAIALSRLCSDPGVASEVVQLQGMPRLIRLCKEERERNHSDGVLVACLAALRKIAANCGTKAIEDLDAMELVEPRLLDSFLIYSSRQESYV